MIDKKFKAQPTWTTTPLGTGTKHVLDIDYGWGLLHCEIHSSNDGTNSMIASPIGLASDRDFATVDEAKAFVGGGS